MTLANFNYLDKLPQFDMFGCKQAVPKICIFRARLKNTIHFRHFDENYRMINVPMQTCRAVAYWTDEASLPEWVKTEVSS